MAPRPAALARRQLAMITFSFNFSTAGVGGRLTLTIIVNDPAAASRKHACRRRRPLLFRWDFHRKEMMI